MISGSAIKFDKRSQIDIHVSGREITCYKYDFSCKLRVLSLLLRFLCTHNCTEKESNIAITQQSS